MDVTELPWHPRRYIHEKAKFFDPRTVELANELVVEMESWKRGNGRSPRGMAAAALWVAGYTNHSRGRLTQDEVAKLFRVSPATVRRFRDEAREALDSLDHNS